MKQFLVTYKKTIPSPHPLLDDDYINCLKVVEVKNVLEINKMFNTIVDIKLLKKKKKRGKKIKEKTR